MAKSKPKTPMLRDNLPLAMVIEKLYHPSKRRGWHGYIILANGGDGMAGGGAS
jgi:hypothetical protein